MNTVKEGFVNVLNHYEIWKTSQAFYHNRTSSVDLDYFLHLPCYHYTDVESINSCNSNVIVIDDVTESVHSKNYFCLYDKTKYYIIISGGSWDKDKHDIGIKNYDLISYPFFLFELVDTYMSPHRFCFYLDKTYDFQYPKDHVFCSTIGNVKDERDKLVDSIIKNIEYKNYILRYSGEDFGAPSNHLDVMNFVKGEFDPYTPVLPEYHHDVASTLPIQIYNSGYAYLVVESDIDYNDCFFMTEKTLKALITGIPFVVVATPFFLSTLKNAGFKTYDELWDESYDSEKNLEKRILKIIKLLQDLQFFDWQKHKSKLQSIADHNLRNFLTCNKIADDFFTSFEHTVENLNDSRR